MKLAPTTPFILIASLLLSLLQSNCASTDTPEYIMLVGSPALRQHEDLRRDGEQHDRFWGNFVAASNKRADQLQANNQLQGQQLTYLVHRPGLQQRARVDGKPYLQWVEENAQKRGGRVVWFDQKSQLIDYLNSRGYHGVSGFEYFGHSNRHCFMLDYSNNLYAASDNYLHEADLSRINSSIFTRDAFCKSWGCHTGQSMSNTFQRAVGTEMIGAIGPTDYTSIANGELPYAHQWVTEYTP